MNEELGKLKKATERGLWQPPGNHCSLASVYDRRRKRLYHIHNDLIHGECFGLFRAAIENGALDLCVTRQRYVFFSVVWKFVCLYMHGFACVSDSGKARVHICINWFVWNVFIHFYTYGWGGGGMTNQLTLFQSTDVFTFSCAEHHHNKYM